MASSGNEKQYIQRRGRVLRTLDDPYPDGTTKEFAEIWDLCVMPDIPESDEEDLVTMEQSLIRNELSRMEIMAESAENDEECREFINKLRKKLNQANT